MPNHDGTGPAGQGSGTGRLRGGCAAGRGNNSNNPGRGPGRRNGGGNKLRGTGAGGRGLNNPNNNTNK